MTQPARLTQQDIDRTMKAVQRAGFERARILLDLENRKIEVIIGESRDGVTVEDTWDDEDT